MLASDDEEPVRCAEPLAGGIKRRLEFKSQQGKGGLANATALQLGS